MSNDTDEVRLVDAIQLACREIPWVQIEALAAKFDSLTSPTPVGQHEARNIVNVARFQGAVDAIWAAWKKEPEVIGASIALGLRTSAAVVDSMRQSQSMDITWTGPSSPHVPVRMTAQVLNEIIDKSTQDLFIVSFAAYKVEEVRKALRKAAERGVKVRLLLETEEDSSGALKHDAADAFKGLKDVVSFWVWPKKKRPPSGASMHAKAVIADKRIALVTSANLTGRALERNMELGLLIQNGPVPARLAEHFDWLIANGELVEVEG